jgi:aspartate/glutamate racemase
MSELRLASEKRLRLFSGRGFPELAEEVAQELGVPITHIVSSVVEELRALKIYSGTIGVIGTKATMSLGLYQNYLGNGKTIKNILMQYN